MLLQTDPELPSMAAFLLAVGIWIVSDWSIAFRYRDPADASQDRGSKRAIGLAVVGGVLVGALAATLAPSLRLPSPTVAFWLGLAVILVGVAVRQYAVWVLDDSFSLVVTVDESDAVVDSGPYRWVRHPSYTGALLSMVGLGIAIANWLSMLVLVVAGLSGYGYRIRVEERALRETLGDEYDEYENRTPYRLVPGLW
ncbi:methyltransferase family protein [Halosolutus amylolyticus]|uniref:Methyltransferase family protein n=1 Tax=Halosolutus amylolyticus TaxID=2932267 RepID=A0ABD5PU91_9EURY|nr:isoprenylcysteine carboxylmethyltransferase family protein [Halosolutus amylolyticus]